MASYRLLCCLLSLAALATQLVAAAGNKYPIVLVHGFAGWGRDELLGFKYWGGFHGDYQAQLQAEGYTVYTATVGPFSSNWDRACELYAVIKGGTVNYGAKHSAHHGHNATGRTFTGLYPQWGTVVNGEVQKIHLIGHSMGGQTIRMLAQLLATGSSGAPVEEDASSHPLFAGGHDDWIHSITTISSPNMGTLLANGLSTTGDLIEDAVAGFFSIAGVAGSSTANIYDAKLDQWGISARASGETMSAYLKRVFSSKMFQPGFEDISLYSLSTTGANQELTWVTTLANIYYYSFSTQDTYRLLKIVLPRPTSMLLPLQPLSVFIGSTYATKNGFTSDWQPNDGAVDTISMRSDGIAEVVDSASVSKLGRWHHISTFTTLDHLAITGVKLLTNVYSVYSTHAALLYGLPTASSRRRLENGNSSMSNGSGSGSGNSSSSNQDIVVFSSEDITVPEDEHTTDPAIVAQFQAVENVLNTFDEEAEVKQLCASTTNADILALCQQQFSS